MTGIVRALWPIFWYGVRHRKLHVVRIALGLVPTLWRTRIRRVLTPNGSADEPALDSAGDTEESRSA